MAETLSLPFSGRTPISRHHSALAAERAADGRATKSMAYWDLLKRIGPDGVTDHDAARILAYPLQSICSIRNGFGDHVIPADSPGLSPYGRTVTKWRRRG